jgi:hypothetical protein
VNKRSEIPESGNVQAELSDKWQITPAFLWITIVLSRSSNGKCCEDLL